MTDVSVVVTTLPAMTARLKITADGQPATVDDQPAVGWKWKDGLGKPHMVAWENGERQYDVEVYLGDQRIGPVPPQAPGVDAAFDRAEQ